MANVGESVANSHVGRRPTATCRHRATAPTGPILIAPRAFPDRASLHHSDRRAARDGDFTCVKRKLDPNYIPLGERFEILRRIDTRRRWKSLDDERVCLLCERKFAGRHLEFRRNQSGSVDLRCPTDGCKATAHEWVYPNDVRLKINRRRRAPALFGLTAQTATA